jgi:hypothetical protein
MVTEDRYARSPGPIDWSVSGTFDTNFRSNQVGRS